MVKTIQTAIGDTVQLRFDLGTSRILKSLTLVDPISGENTADFETTAANIFLAGYKRGFAVLKQPQPLTDESARELFYELELSEAISIVKTFTESMSVAADPEAPKVEPVEGEGAKKS